MPEKRLKISSPIRMVMLRLNEQIPVLQVLLCHVTVEIKGLFFFIAKYDLRETCFSTI
jgi:hypothetical protein